MTILESRTVGICVICFAISTSTGSLAAKLGDVYIAPEYRDKGIGSNLLSTVIKELRQTDVARINTSVHFNNADAKRCYERNGFKSLDEERLSLLL